METVRPPVPASVVIDLDAARDLRLRKTELVIITAMVYLATSLVLLLPAYTLASGVRAAGRAVGLWLGDATSPGGGEAWALMWGALLLSGGLIVAGLVLRMVARRYSLSAIPSIVTGTLVVLALIGTVCVGVVTSIPDVT